MIGPQKGPVDRAEAELAKLFAEDGGVSGAIAWARTASAQSDSDPVAHPLRTLRELRRADKRLSAVAARYLVEAVAGREPRPPSRPNPLLH